VAIADHDQRNLWIANYGSRPAVAEHASVFSAQYLPLLPTASSILELGCGRGADAEAFARAGHTVTATDFVPAVIEDNQKRLGHMPNLVFQSMRIDRPYPYDADTFDAAYAHLTLHYFTHDITQSVVTEIHRVLKPGGLLLFACKSPADPAHGKGREIEQDMFDFHGKIRHFFSEDYVRGLLTGIFQIVAIESHRGKLYRQRAGWITVAARAT